VGLTIHKRIWVAAGLGGGSSDAGAVLAGLQRSLVALPARRLAGLAAGLGADVPFFLEPRPARVTGIGQRVTPLADWPALELVLANPGVPLGTAGIYRGLGLQRGDPPRSAPPPPPRAPSAGLAARLVHNDLLGPAVQGCPAIRDLMQKMKDLGSLGQGLSGSGPTVFGIFERPEQCARAAAAIRQTAGWMAAATTTTTA
jgi:4-diphosphocytidyl-2-C-methyl-D-erythritol kinase